MSLSSNLFVRSFSSRSALQSAIKNVTVIGGGLMGAGIAQVSNYLEIKPAGSKVINCNAKWGSVQFQGFVLILRV